MRTKLGAVVGIALGVAPALASDAAQDWAFPPLENAAAPKEADGAPDTTPIRLEGSARSFTPDQLGDLTHAVDWFPASHPTAPPAVMAGERGAAACGFCHLVQGEGRPENATLAGLPADYIRRQVAAFASGARTGLRPDWRPTANMVHTAKAADPAAVAKAADWFAARRFAPHVQVVEAGTIPHAIAARFVYETGPGPREPLGERIVETPVDMARFERRDPRMTYVAYVPPGAIARGKALAARGGPAGQPCALCHGPGLTGAIGPPLAGRSPSYLARQLMGLRAGARTATEAEAMRAVAAPLTDAQIIDVAAYAASVTRQGLAR